MMIFKNSMMFLVVSLLLPFYSDCSEKAYPWYKHGLFALATGSSAFCLGMNLAGYHYYSKQVQANQPKQKEKPKNAVRAVINGKVINPDENGEIRYKDDAGNEVLVLNDGTRKVRGNISIFENNSSASMSYGDITVTGKGAIHVANSKGTKVSIRHTVGPKKNDDEIVVPKTKKMQKLEEKRNSYFYKMCGLTALTAACGGAWYWAANKKK